MKSPTLLLSFLLWCLIVSAKAHNNYFLPGDALFSVSLTRDVVREWMSNDGTDFEFNYSRFDGQFMACGNIGYTKLKVTGVDDKFRSALVEAYWRFTRGVYPEFQEVDYETGEQRQTNAVVALIYNEDFDGILGLKYNENWIKEGAGVYGGLFSSSRPVVLDWRSATDFESLKLDKPIKSLAHLGGQIEVHHTVETPLEISAKGIKIALVGIAKDAGSGTQATCPNLESIFMGSSFAEYVMVYSNRYEFFSFDENGRKEHNEIRMPVDEDDSEILGAEQGGAEQPATAPESKPEGEKKSKLESKGRSQ